MKLSAQLEQALNNQINLELTSAYVYFAMAAHFEHSAFTGFGKWMEIQATEELGHANRFFKYMADRGSRVKLGAIAEPRSDFKSPLEAFQMSLAHEQKVTAAINSLYELAGTEKDFATQAFLKWFLDEQVEEEKSVGDIVAKLELVGDNRNGLFQLDQFAGRRATETH
jgi:ferritin